MYNFDYIPLDQEVIGQAVAEFEKRRKESREFVRNASKNAGGNADIIVFRNRQKLRRIVRALDDLRICWYEIDGEIYANRHEVEEEIRK